MSGFVRREVYLVPPNAFSAVNPTQWFDKVCTPKTPQGAKLQIKPHLNQSESSLQQCRSSSCLNHSRRLSYAVSPAAHQDDRNGTQHTVHQVPWTGVGTGRACRLRAARGANYHLRLVQQRLCCGYRGDNMAAHQPEEISRVHPRHMLREEITLATCCGRRLSQAHAVTPGKCS